MATVTKADVVSFLTLIEMHARSARETLCLGMQIGNAPEPLLKPGDPPKPHSNQQIAHGLMQRHGAEFQGLQQAYNAMMDALTAPVDPIAGRLGPRLNGTSHGDAP